jgi:hypothetical protein
MLKKKLQKHKNNLKKTIMNIDDNEKFGRDEPTFQDENPYGEDLNRQFKDIDNNRNDEDDYDDIDKESRDDEEDYDDVDDDDLEEDGDLDDDDDDLEDTDRPGDLYKDVDLSLQDEVNQDREEVDAVNHQRKF